MALMLAQTMAAEAGTDNDGVEWKVVDGTSLVRVMLVSVRKATRRSHKCEKILEVSLWGPANRLRTSLNCSAIAASSRTNSAIVELHGIASLLRACQADGETATALSGSQNLRSTAEPF